MEYVRNAIFLIFFFKKKTDNDDGKGPSLNAVTLIKLLREHTSFFYNIIDTFVQEDLLA